jgi:putative phage-type endonuclease
MSEATLAPPIELLPPAETGPHSERWHELRREGVTASEVAAILGLSKWDSAFNLYWSKVNGWADSDNDEMAVGRHLEGAIADWWATECDPLENLVAERAGLYAHPERPWQLATPDRRLFMVCPGCDGAGKILPPNLRHTRFICQDCDGAGVGDRPVSLLECKWVAYSWDGWGEQGTDDVPVYYRAQALWQLDVMGVDEVFVAALGPGGFRQYRVRRDEKDLRVMRAAGLAFHQRFAAKDPPDIDSHIATASALRRLHPDVGDGPVEVPLELAEGYRRARALRDRAKDVVARYEARIRAALGSTYSRAECGKKLVASRSVFERRSDDQHELLAMDDDWPTTDRLNPGRSASYA